jgi:hypothetical protein
MDWEATRNRRYRQSKTNIYGRYEAGEAKQGRGSGKRQWTETMCKGSLQNHVNEEYDASSKRKKGEADKRKARYERRMCRDTRSRRERRKLGRHGARS